MINKQKKPQNFLNYPQNYHINSTLPNDLYNILKLKFVTSYITLTTIASVRKFMVVANPFAFIIRHYTLETKFNQI